MQYSFRNRENPHNRIRKRLHPDSTSDSSRTKIFDSQVPTRTLRDNDVNFHVIVTATILTV